MSLPGQIDFKRESIACTHRPCVTWDLGCVQVISIFQAGLETGTYPGQGRGRCELLVRGEGLHIVAVQRHGNVHGHSATAGRWHGRHSRWLCHLLGCDRATADGNWGRSLRHWCRGWSGLWSQHPAAKITTSNAWLAFSKVLPLDLTTSDSPHCEVTLNLTKFYSVLILSKWRDNEAEQV